MEKTDVALQLTLKIMDKLSVGDSVSNYSAYGERAAMIFNALYSKLDLLDGPQNHSASTVNEFIDKVIEEADK